MIITLFIAGILAGLIQYFVDFKGLPLFQPKGNDASNFSGEIESIFQKFIGFIKKHWQFFGYLTVGIAGAFLVPLLNVFTADKLPGLIEFTKYADCTANCNPPSLWYFLILLGYGIVSGYSAVRIIRGIGAFFLSSISEKQEELQKKLEEAQKQIDALKAKQPPLPTPDSLVNNSFTPLSTENLSTDYFNSAQDEIDRKGYYASIDFERSEALFAAISLLISNSHKTRLKYKPSIHLYPIVDKHKDKLLRSIYSGKSFDLETILALDAQVDKARADALMNFSSLSLTNEELESKTEKLEELLPYNCEHVVPQSWFDKKEPMRGDLHHLFTCEMRCNSFRSNNPYFDFPDYGTNYAELIRDECGKLEKNYFEPEVNKGVVARAVLYFLLRYQGEITNNKGYKLKDIPMLLKWHKDNPVSLYELHRNQQIFKVQGNRNPFIDFPDLVDKIDFKSINEFGIITTKLSGDEVGNVVFDEASMMNACRQNPNPKPWKFDDSRLADSLVQLRNQVNALAPNRSKLSDGWFADDAHQQTDSDHNPRFWDNATQKGIVTALDITHDLTGKCD